MEEDDSALKVAHEASRSSLMVLAASGADSGSRKSSQGFASETTLTLMPCLVMKARFAAKDEYEASTGRPREEGGLEASSSEGRIIRRGSEVPSVGL